jgi:hypothetical protein
MNHKKKEIVPEEINYKNSISRMERWHLCQNIGKIYYDTQLSFDQLLQIKEYFENNGVGN